jgi:hypothetical protein
MVERRTTVGQQAVLAGRARVAAIAAPAHQQHAVARFQEGPDLEDAPGDIASIAVEVDQDPMVRLTRRFPRDEVEAVGGAQPDFGEGRRGRGQIARREIHQAALRDIHVADEAEPDGERHAGEPQGEDHAPPSCHAEAAAAPPSRRRGFPLASRDGA